jgi:SAM-dependent methyltransferase
MTCRICGAAAGTTHHAHEMMFGTRDPFDYFECAECGCVQLMNPPADFAPYYPRDYYSFASAAAPTSWKQRIRALRNRGTFAPRGLIDRALALAMPGPNPHARQWVSRTGATPNSRILDVGCGSGVLLRELAAAGFHRLLGVDPFIDGDLSYPDGVRVQRGTIDDVPGEFDLIMMHHSFEHMSEPAIVLAAVAKRLVRGGWALIRIPTASSWAWEHYREHWAQLDPPRHVFVHTVDSMTHLAKGAGLQLDAVVDDSTEFQFTASELNRRGQPLSTLSSAFASSEMREFRRRARELNAQRRGDQAAFYLRKA